MAKKKKSPPADPYPDDPPWRPASAEQVESFLAYLRDQSREATVATGTVTDADFNLHLNLESATAVRIHNEQHQRGREAETKVKALHRAYSENARKNTGPRKKQYESEYPDWRQTAIAELVKHPGRRDKKLVTEVRKATPTLAARSTVNAWIKRDGVEIRAEAKAKALQNGD